MLTRLLLAAPLLLLLELLIFVQVVRWSSFGSALLLALWTSLLGIVLLGRVRSVAHRRVQAGQAPTGGAVLETTLNSIGSVLLVFPGFLTDVIGLLLHVPPIQKLVGRKLRSLLEQSAGHVFIGGFPPSGASPGGFPPGGFGNDVGPKPRAQARRFEEGDIIDVEVIRDDEER